MAAPVDRFSLCQLRTIVNAHGVVGIVSNSGTDSMPFINRHREHIRQVVLALGVRIANFGQVILEKSSGVSEYTRIDLADCPFFFRRVFVLNNAAKLALIIAKHATIAGRIIKNSG